MATLRDEGSGPDPKSTRSRSFGGCATCRTRHVKCDERRPTCSTCTTSGQICGGYEKGIFFDLNQDSGVIRFRRPLLTEGERICMTDWLTSSVPPNTALRVLSQIDEECEDATALHDFEVYRGPFGAFRVSQNEPFSAINPLSHGSGDISPPEDAHQYIDDQLVLSDIAFSSWNQDLVDTIFEQAEQISIPTYTDMLDISMDTGRIQEVFDSISIPELVQSSINPPALPGYQYPGFLSSTQFNQQLSPNSSSSLFVTTANNNIPSETVLLLKHYATTVISSFTPFHHTKTPWHILFLPHAKNCLAALTLGESVDHASLCAFYGTLAISAFSLAVVSQSQTWLEQAQKCKQEAREHVRLMLKTAYDVPKAAKYKSILMALITMVQVSVFSGARDQTECYLLEAEKFIRLRGLKRRKSRKVRLLHHCYVYMRMFHESTVLCGTNSSQRHHVRRAVESSGLVIYGQDSLSFRLMPWNNLDQQLMVVKTQEEGENDLHLGQPGLFHATLYPEIYGISEAWFYLLSQVIRLGNEKDAAEYGVDDDTNSLPLKDFMSRAKNIECCIKHLPRPNLATSSSTNQPVDQDVLERIFDGMQSALEIYFYRRIYDVDASMLQQKVLSIRDWLFQNESPDSGVVYGSMGFMWPAFIAACEAEDPEVQVAFSIWFRSSAQRNGLPFFTKTLETIEQVWQEKRNVNKTSVTWLDLMRRDILLQQHL